MWPFPPKKTLPQQGVFQGFIDHHSHILPGVDDGVQTMEDALHILHTYETLGIKEVYLTPHIQEYLPNTTNLLTQRFSELQSAYSGPITLHLSAEYMLDNLLLQRLHQGDLLYYRTTSPQNPRNFESSKLLLVETSYLNPPINLPRILQEIQSYHITPILAHPERYLYMTHEDYQRLHDQGILFQLNLPSLLGAYGKTPQKRARHLLSQGFYSLSGTDIHSPNLLPLLQNKSIPLIPMSIPKMI